ncbi:hypothetical protein [Granulicella sp. L60]|uniref:hypothetical protein n=1 Tax=Granulicella sp. L60 TaxID=1641866 RepID=UPI00131CDC10|nr:hypothetical protein [Granulicella sp. L60]
MDGRSPQQQFQNGPEGIRLWRPSWRVNGNDLCIGCHSRIESGLSPFQYPGFNHGAEAQNYDFTQGMENELAVFFPGVQDPMMISRRFIASILAELKNHGYLVVENPKWGSMPSTTDILPAGSFPKVGKNGQTQPSQGFSTVRQTIVDSAERRAKSEKQIYRL